MPTRPLTQGQLFLFPADLGELIPERHTVRFVSAFVDALRPEDWQKLGMDLQGNPLGASSYHPKLLLSVWLYGFMVGIRSTRALERACYDQLPLLWLTGWQKPDHNSLWRFYSSHRESMRALFKKTVRTAVDLDLVDLTVQAVDGTKIKANARRHQTFGKEDLEHLMTQIEKTIQELEAQNEAAHQSQETPLPTGLAQAQELREQIRQALERADTAEGAGRGNLTDPDAVLMQGREGVLVAYNAQAMASSIKTECGGGMLITAADVTNAAHDHGQLVPMIEGARENTGDATSTTLADGGYHSGESLSDCDVKGYRVLMPESQRQALKSPYHKDRFSYDAESDSFVCPHGQQLKLSSIRRRKNKPDSRIYRACPQFCRKCPAFGTCTRCLRHGRMIEVGQYDKKLQEHRALMAQDQAKAAFKKRKQLIEPVFGIMKETQDARRFLTRGLDRVRAEWFLLSAAFNLRTLCRIWARGIFRTSDLCQGEC